MHSNYLVHYYRLLLSHPFPGSRVLCWFQGVPGARSGGHGTRSSSPPEGPRALGVTASASWEWSREAAPISFSPADPS